VHELRALTIQITTEGLSHSRLIALIIRSPLSHSEPMNLISVALF
jgi:hypothetical protein